MIKKSQLKFGDILITNHIDQRYKFYIFCNTDYGPYFIGNEGCLNVANYNNNLHRFDNFDYCFRFIQVFRPPIEVAHKYQHCPFAFRDNIKIPIIDMIQKSVDITNGINSAKNNFIDIIEHLL